MPDFFAAILSFAKHKVDSFVGPETRQHLGYAAKLDELLTQAKIRAALQAANSEFNTEIEDSLVGVLTTDFIEKNLFSENEIDAFLKHPNSADLKALLVKALENDLNASQITDSQRKTIAETYVNKVELHLSSVSREIADQIILGYHQSHDRKLDALHTDLKGLRNDFERFPSPPPTAQKIEYVDYNPPTPPDPDTIPEPTDLPPGSRLELGRNPTFVGREVELQKLAEMLLHNPTGDAAVITTGFGGVGKTQLAIEFAHRYGQYFRGVHWISAQSGDLRPDIATCGVKMGLDLPQELAGKVETTLQEWERRPDRLIIVDNAENPAVFSEVWPQLSKSRVLITSRRSDWDAQMAADTISLDVFTPSQSRELLRKLAPRLNSIPDKELDEIGEKVGYLPLAIDLIGNYLRRLQYVTPTRFLEEVSAMGAALKHKALQTFSKPEHFVDQERWLNVVACFKLSWDQLKPAKGMTKVNRLAQKILRGCSYCAPNYVILVELLQTAFDNPEDEKAPSFHEALTRLYDLGLLREGEAGPIIHPLMAEFGRMEDRGANRNTFTTIADALADLSKEAVELRTTQEFEPFFSHIKSIAEMSQIRGIEASTRLWNNLGRHLRKIKNLNEAENVMLRAIATAAEFYGENTAEVATRVSNLAGILKDIGDLEQAKTQYERALAIDTEVSGPNDPQVAIRLNGIGTVLRRMDDLEGAREVYERALKIDEAKFGPNNSKVAIRVSNLAGILKDMGDYEQAKPLYERALAIDTEEFGPNDPKVAIRLNNLGTVLRRMDDLEAALKVYERALEIDEAKFGPDDTKVATRTNNIGLVLRLMGDLEGAESKYERALLIDEAKYGSNHLQVALRLNNLGFVLELKGDLQAAKLMYERALAIRQQFLEKGHSKTKSVEEKLSRVNREISERGADSQ